MKLSEIKITPLLDTLRLEDIDDATYFSEKFSNYISNSRLSLINPDQNGCPKDFFEGLSKHVKFSDSLLFGSAIHQLVLQPDSFFLVTTVDRPTAKAGLMADELFDPDHLVPTDEAIIAASDKVDYYKGKMTSKKINDLKIKCIDYWTQRAKFEADSADTRIPIYMDSKGREKLQACLSSIDGNSDIESLLYPSKDIIKGNEKTILLDVLVEAPEQKPIVLKLKSKLDNYTIDPNTNTITVNDVKTCGRPIADFPYAVTNYHYNREIAMYSWLLTQCATKFYNMEHPEILGNFLVVETIPEFQSAVVPLTKDQILRGFKEFKTLLKTVAFYCYNGYEDFGIPYDVQG